MEKIFPRIASVRLNTGEASGSRPLQRAQEDALMVPKPRENSQGGRTSRESSGRLADVENISPRIVSVRSNTGETSGSRPLQRQENALMVPNPRENSRGGRAFRDTPGRLADVEKISPRIASVRSNTGETPGSSLVQRQKGALMVPNPRENSRGGRASRETPGRLADVEKTSPRIVSVRSNTGETPGSRPLQRQEDALMVPNSRENSRGERASRESSGRLADVEKISPRIVSVRSYTGETSGSSLVQRQKDALMVPNPRENSRGGRRFREKYTGDTSPTKTEIPAEMVERSFVQESPHSLPGSVPSRPPDGLVREPLYQEDTCHHSEHTTSHQKQSRISELNRIWDDRKFLLADTALSLKDKQNIVLRMARMGSELVLFNDGSVGDVATGIGGTLVLPPFNVDDVKNHFGEVKGFPGISDLVEIIKHGVPVITSATPTDPRQALQYGNHSSIQEHRSTVWKKLCEDVRRNRCLVFTREAAAKIVGLRVAPLGDVVTRKVRTINDYSFDPTTARGEKGGLNRDTVSEEAPPCLCGEALPALLNVLTDLRIRFPNRGILLAKADFTEAFRNVKVAPDQAQKCY